MTAVLDPTTTTSGLDARPTSLGLWRSGLAAGAVAAAATTAIVVVARALDVAVAVDGERIPLVGFPQMTVLCTVVGILIARSLARRSAQPVRRFVQATVVLTALSLVPDLTAATGAADKLTLVTTHLVAAAIVIPTIARRLATPRTS
jgi:hypothetical protein